MKTITDIIGSIILLMVEAFLFYALVIEKHNWVSFIIMTIAIISITVWSKIKEIL